MITDMIPVDLWAQSFTMSCLAVHLRCGQWSGDLTKLPPGAVGVGYTSVRFAPA
jgi:hypothetical protein